MTDTFVCDYCNRSHPTHDRVVVALPRPSDPDELVAVMWGCGLCEDSVMLPSATEVTEAIEETQMWQGTAYLWVTV